MRLTSQKFLIYFTVLRALYPHFRYNAYRLARRMRQRTLRMGKIYLLEVYPLCSTFVVMKVILENFYGEETLFFYIDKMTSHIMTISSIQQEVDFEQKIRYFGNISDREKFYCKQHNIPLTQEDYQIFNTSNTL